jgi:thymidine phosphorylase
MQVTAGDYIRKGDTIARIFSSDYATCLTAADIVKSAITVSDDKPDTIPPVLEVIE